MQSVFLSWLDTEEKPIKQSSGDETRQRHVRQRANILGSSAEEKQLEQVNRPRDEERREERMCRDDRVSGGLSNNPEGRKRPKSGFTPSLLSSEPGAP